MKKMFLLFSLSALLLGGKVYAQNSNNNTDSKTTTEKGQCEKSCQKPPQVLTPESIELLKEAYIKENLTMSDKEQTAFWKSYEKYNEAKKQACDDAKSAMEKAGIKTSCEKKDKSEQTKEDTKPTAEQQVTMKTIQMEKRQSMLSAEQTFYKELAKNLSNDQIVQYMQLEKAFQMEMKKLQQRDQGPRCCEGMPQCGQQKGEKMPKPQSMGTIDCHRPMDASQPMPISEPTKN